MLRDRGKFGRKYRRNFINPKRPSRCHQTLIEIGDARIPASLSRSLAKSVRWIHPGGLAARSEPCGYWVGNIDRVHLVGNMPTETCPMISNQSQGIVSGTTHIPWARSVRVLITNSLSSSIHLRIDSSV
jgi:hypothetical protein